MKKGEHVQQSTRLLTGLMVLGLALGGAWQGKALAAGVSPQTDEVLVGVWAGENVQGSAAASEGESVQGAGAASEGAGASGPGTASEGAAGQGAGTASESAAGQGAAAVGTAAEESWSLILVNRTHPIPEDYVIPSLTQLSGGHQVDSRIYPALQQMFDDARAQGIYPAITSSYRSAQDQQSQMDAKISEYLASGYSQEEAQRLAEEWVAIPGTSEHQLGLSVDISSDAASGQDPGSVWYWLLENSWRYGFIKRYPEDKTEITGIINEPWHYRYVGVHAATLIAQQGICLEEYLQQTSGEDGV